MRDGFGWVSARMFKRPLAFSCLWRKSSGEGRSRVGVVGRPAGDKSNCCGPSRKDNLSPKGAGLFSPELQEEECGGTMSTALLWPSAHPFSLYPVPCWPCQTQNLSQLPPFPALPYFSLLQQTACSCSSPLLQSPHSPLIQPPPVV